MSLSDYKFCDKSAEVKAIKNKESYSVTVGGKVACSSSSGGVHRFQTEGQAVDFGNKLVKGYNAGTFLSSDIENYITN